MRLKINFATLLLLLALSMTFSSCLREVFCVEGEGDTLTETLIIEDFVGINLTEAAHVRIIQSETQKVTVTAKENILERLDNDVVGGIWNIDLGRDCFQDLELKIDIQMKDLKEIEIKGSGEVVVESFTDQGDLDIDISGSGLLVMNEFAGTKDLDINISGSGDIEADGAFSNLEKMDFDLSGSGLLDGFSITTKELDAKISGSGKIFVTVEDRMDVKISGSGDLHYKGNPFIDAKITGSGKIINEN